MHHGELRSDRGSWFVIQFFLFLVLFNIHDTFKTRNWSSYIFLKLEYFTNHNCVKQWWDQNIGNLSGVDSHPVTLSCQNVEKTRTVRPVHQANQKSKTKKKNEDEKKTVRPVLFRNPGMAARIQRKSRGWWSSWTQRLTRQFFSWTVFRAYACEKCGFG